jgi:hypothetical protein
MPPQAIQLSLFQEPAKDGETIIPILVYGQKGNYVAEIAGGWWIGHGATKEAAVKNAVLAYENESEAYAKT